MAPRLRKAVLTAHVATSVGWVGAVAVFLALAVAGLRGGDEMLVRSTYLAMQVTARQVIVPLALASLTIGVVQSVGTRWGLLRHYWVVAKLLVTVLATAILLLQLGPIDRLAAVAAERALVDGELHEARVSLVVHAAGGLATLLVPTALSIVKPRGLTRRGRRRPRPRNDHETPGGALVRAGPGPYPDR
jgi:hypothetical protein